MSRARWSFSRPALPLLGLLAVLALSACDLDTETALKQRLDRWVSVGSNTFFKSNFSCTAAVYDLRDLGFKSAITRADSVNEGLRALKNGRPVAFDLTGKNPTEVSEAIATSDLPEGIGLLGAGVSGADCMSDEITKAYVTALRARRAVLIFDTTDNALAIADFADHKVYYVRSRQ